MKIGFFYSCYKEKNAIDFSISELRKYYPDSPIYLVSDGGLDFSYLEKEYSNIKTSIGEDTMSSTFKITNINFKESIHQYNIKKCVIAVIERLKECIKYCQSDYIVMMDPDALIRGKLNIPNGVKLLGSRVNSGFPIEYRNILSNISGAKVINNWGATPAIFYVETFLISIEIFNDDLMDKFCKSFYAMYAHDVLLPTLFALVGEEETFNPDIVECKRTPEWEKLKNPLVHQYKKFY
jgi:hypothetical protein